MGHFEFLESHRDITTALQGEYNLLLVALSVVVAILASYTAFLMRERYYASKGKGSGWAVLGALALGCGIWAMHFIGMLAFSLPIPVHYSIPLTLLSVVPAFLASLVVLAGRKESQQSKLRMLFNSVLMGAGIGAMHYTGMAAMNMSGEMRYDPTLFSFSIVVAVALSLVSLKVKQWAESDGLSAEASKRSVYIAAVVMGAAVSAMHYTGMAAVYYFPAQHEMAGIQAWDTLSFALFIALVISVLLILLVSAVYFSRRFELVEELKSSENHLKNMFETIVEGIMTIDENGILETFNPAAEKLFGYKQSEVVGKNVSMLMPKADSSQHNGYIRNYLEGGEKKVIGIGREVEGRRKDGSVFPLELAVNVVERQGRRIFIGVTHDVSERKSYEKTLKKKQRREKFLKETANAANTASSTDGALQAIINMVGEFLGWQFGHIFSWQETAFVSDDIWYMTDEQRYKQFQAVTKDVQFKFGKGIPGLIAKYSTHYWLEDLNTDPNYLRGTLVELPFSSGVFFPVIVDNKVTAVFEFYSEKPHAYDQELFEILDEIGVQVGYVIQRKKAEEDLVRARDAAQAASKAKSQFLATMSHEIRTPLNGVLGMLHLLKKTTLDSKQWRYVSTAAGSSEMLLTVINDILDFSKMEAGKLELESIPFDPVNLVEETAALLATSAQQKGLELICTVDAGLPGLLKGDPTRLRQILTNLANNAIKFTEEGEVVLRVAHANDRVEFMVTDTGIGMSEEQQEAVFKPFTQADSATTRKFGGTGLGLAICRLLVEEMGGKLSVASEPGRGSQFSFDLPLAALSSSQQRNVISKVLANKRILVVDDNATNLEVVKNILKNWNIKCIGLAESGKSALQMLESAVEAEEPYDVVITDMHMPEMDGLELARIIRDDHRMQSMRLVMLSSVDCKDPVEILDAWLTKPTRQSELYNCLMRIFGVTREEVVSDDEAESWWFGGRKLLLVEDNEVNQDIAREILIDVGFSVDVRDNGEQALHAVQEKNYDAVLMDIQMPVMDGMEATKQIRLLAGDYAELPIIAMTAHALAGDSDKSLAAGMNGHVTKPINPDEVFKELSRWVEVGEKGDVEKTDNEKPQSNIDAISELPGIDLEAGLNRMRGNWPAYKRILLAFRQKQSDTADVIEQYVKHDILDEAARLAHTLKGSAGNLGADALFQQAAAVEAACLGDKKDDALTAVAVLQTELQIVMDGLEVLEQEKESAEEAKPLREIDSNELLQLLEQLENSLGKDIGEAQAHLDLLRGCSVDAVITNGLDEIADALNRFDTKSAGSTVQRLQEALS